MIGVKDLCCGYGTKPVLREVTLSLSPGERVALLGPNGSGKSTLLRTMAGLLQPLSGSIQISGHSLEALSPIQIAQHVAMVFQSVEPAFEFSVRNVVAFGRLPWQGDTWWGPVDESGTHVESALARLGIESLADSPVTELSGGELQRVMIAKALAQQPQILLLDEPTSHQDPKHQIEIARLVQELASEGVAILFAVHDVSWALHAAARAVVITGGTVEFDGGIDSPELPAALERAYGVAFNPEGQLCW
ncbi:MAG: ABC transporter ATP-binding protein [Armatimonadetes bacterium]|nr:ABC transporter ATP-binding protein [Armatimonadota bacterium]